MAADGDALRFGRREELENRRSVYVMLGDDMLRPYHFSHTATLPTACVVVDVAVLRLIEVSFRSQLRLCSFRHYSANYSRGKNSGPKRKFSETSTKTIGKSFLPTIPPSIVTITAFIDPECLRHCQTMSEILLSVN